MTLTREMSFIRSESTGITNIANIHVKTYARLRQINQISREYISTKNNNNNNNNNKHGLINIHEETA